MLHIYAAIVLTLVTSSICSFHHKRDSCPEIWSTISATLVGDFVDSSTGQCTNLARGSIRAAFHDCGTWDTTQGATGGCDGSLLLSGEASRTENNGLAATITYLQNLHDNTYSSVGVADFIQFAGAVGVVACPGGPQITTLIGRTDSSTQPPAGLLPIATGEGSDATTLLTLFQNKGFDAIELAALVGAHSCSKQQFEDPSEAGLPQDTTPGTWDVVYYQQTIDSATSNATEGEIVVFPSDVNLATDASTPVAAAFATFVNAQEAWNAAFAAAMAKMALLGVSNQGSMVDCTSALPAAQAAKRDFLNPHTHVKHW